MSFLFVVDSSVPSSPGFKGSEHSTFSTHVTESGLSRSVSTRSRNSGNSGNSSSGSPGFGGMFFSGHNVNSMSLSSIFVDIGVNELDDIKSDGGGENGGEGDFFIGNVDVSGVVN